MSIDQLAREHGMNDRTLNDILKNPIYNGWAMRKGERAPAAWRDSPPVDDELWNGVSRLLAARTRGGGPRRAEVPDPLRGLLRCACGSTIRAAGFMGGKRRRIHSAQPCPEGVEKKIWDSDTWLMLLEAQIRGLLLDDEAVSAIIAALAEPLATVVPIDRGRQERRRRELALDMAAGRIGERAFVAEMRRLNEEELRVGGDARGSVDAAKAVDYIRNFASSWAKAKPLTRATMIQSLYEEVVVRGEEFIIVRLFTRRLRARPGARPAAGSAGAAASRARPAAEIYGIFTRLLTTGDTFVLGDAAMVMVRWTIQPGAVDELRALRRASLVERPHSPIGETLYRAEVDGPTERGETYVNIGRWRSSDAFYEEVGCTERGVAPSKRDFDLAQRWRAWLIPDE